MSEVLNPSLNSSPPAGLVLEDISYRYGAKTALSAVSGALSSRSIGLLGPNCAGKTTLLRLVTNC